ncbi:MAG: addiction module protein [Pirellulales bacterium]
MSDILSNFDFHGLSSPEKLEVIGRLWDSIPDSPAELPLPDSHREELERRLEAADADPSAAVPWEAVRERLRQKP